MKELTINCICVIMGILLGVAIEKTLLGLPSVTKSTPQHVGIFRYEDAQNRVWTVELNKDGTCKTALHESLDIPCTYTVEDGNKIHFDGVNESYDAIYGDEGLLYQNHIFKQFK